MKFKVNDVIVAWNLPKIYSNLEGRLGKIICMVPLKDPTKSKYEVSFGNLGSFVLYEGEMEKIL